MIRTKKPTEVKTGTGFKTKKRTVYQYSEREHAFVIEMMNLYNIEEPKFEYANKLVWLPEIPGYVTYVLMCSNGQKYKGMTSNFKQRMLQHFNGGGSVFTTRYPPIYVYHHECFDTKEAATARELFFKSPQGFHYLNNYYFLKQFKPKENESVQAEN